MKAVLFIAILYAVSLNVLIAGDSTRVEKTLVPSRITEAPEIDGDLTDACWQKAAVAKDFITNSPVFGKTPAQPTEVRVLYDNTALYVGAYMYDTEPQNIRRNLSQRDHDGNADDFIVALDTYDDDQNAFRFIITAAGVQSEGKMTPNDYDSNWDPVWESKVRVVSNGWIAEIRIPYSAIRFPSKAVQRWGLQFGRTIFRVGEYSTWSPVDPSINGAIPQWGALIDLNDIEPPTRLSLSPYIAMYAERTPVATQPVEYANGWSLTGGLDLKYGINESFTLDATLIPDFGQVQSDNLVLNLSPFETRYDERRPFFTEGTELFSKGDIFYSRRIGGTPDGFYAAFDSIATGEHIVTNPSQQQLYNATKISGRTSGGLGIGMLNAIVAPSYASLRNDSTSVTRKVRTGELTNFNIFVLDQTLPNNSAISLTNTSVLREGAARDADVAALVSVFHDNSNTYEWTGKGWISLVRDPTVDENIRTGYAYRLGFSKVSGEFGFDLAHDVTTKEFDPNDLSILSSTNVMSNFAGIHYNDYEPSGILLNWGTSLGINHEMHLAPLAYQSLTCNLSGNVYFDNRWSAGCFVSLKPIGYYDYYEPRVEGRKYKHAPVGFMSIWASTDNTKAFGASATFNFGESTLPDDPYIGGNTNMRYRFSDKFSVELSLSADKDLSSWGFVDLSGQDIIYGRRDVATTTMAIGTGYIFNPKMNLTLLARHYWSNVVYRQFYTLLESGEVGPTSYTGSFDRNFNAFNLDAVFYWEFAPGSVLNLVWKNNIIQGDGIGNDGYLPNVRKTFAEPHANTLTLKVMYYLDYLDLKRVF